MDYTYEFQCIVEEHRRGVMQLRDEFEELQNSMRGHNGHELAAAIEAKQEERARLEAEENARLEAEENERQAAERAQQERLEAEARAQREAKEREAIARSIAARQASAEALPINEAIARSRAARKVNDYVVPIDDDDYDPDLGYRGPDIWHR
ncbi:hypothetical protein [Nocardia xishanensis]|uniref:hypothetical protein n=1 Tax=Nocardia xishanensis TaxID=238964 RepID=UPI0034261D58